MMPIRLSDRSVVSIPAFFSQARAMRAQVDAHFQNPYRQTARNYCWNYWYVPGRYTYLRCDALRFFSAKLAARFVRSLTTWSQSTLGLAPIGPVRLSVYVNGCGQQAHNDAHNGRFGWVYSLSRTGEFSGGETLVFRDAALDYWRSGQSSIPSARQDLCHIIRPRFNQLTVFDDALIHAVSPVEGTMDPLRGRIVLHGHLAETGLVIDGPLDAREVSARLARELPSLSIGLAQFGDVQGVATVRLTVHRSGKTTAATVLCSTLRSRSGGRLSAAQLRLVLAPLVERVRFAPSQKIARVIFPLAVGGKSRPQVRRQGVSQ